LAEVRRLGGGLRSRSTASLFINIRAWKIFAGEEQHVMHDVRVVDDGRQADHVIVGVIRQEEALADVRRLVCRHRRQRETQRYVQNACSQRQTETS